MNAPSPEKQARNRCNRLANGRFTGKRLTDGVYVSRETIDIVLSACPGDEWKAIVALARFAGLRVPAEFASLTWGDIDWKASRLTIRSQKTNAARSSASYCNSENPGAKHRKTSQVAPAGFEPATCRL